MQPTTMRVSHGHDVRAFCSRSPRACLPTRPRAIAGGERPVSPAANGSAEPSSSACPFAQLAKKDGPVVDPPAQSSFSSSKQPSTWRVLQPGEGEKQQLPTPAGRFCWMPLVGDAMEVDQGAGQFYLERYREFGPIFTWQMGPDQVIDVVDYVTISSLMAQDSKVMVSWSPEAFYAMLGEFSKKNMTNPERRMQQRKFLAAGFTDRAVAGYLGKLESICRDQLDTWSASPSMDLASQAKALSFEFSTQLLVNINVLEEEKQLIRGWFDDVFKAMVAPAVNLPGTRFWRGVQSKAKLSKALEEMIRTSREQQQQLNPKSTSPSPAAAGAAGGLSKSKTAASRSMFDTMIAVREEFEKQEDEQYRMSDSDMAEAAIGVIIAGNDTSGLGIQGLLGMVASFPEVLQQLREEQQQVMAAHGPGLSRAALESMPYADAVIKEVLRLLPPAGGVFRKTLVDLEVHGHYIPAGSILHLNFLTAQQITDPRLNPTGPPTQEDISALLSSRTLPPLNLGPVAMSQTFNPSRWLNNNKMGWESSPPSDWSSSSSAAAAAAGGAAAAGTCPVPHGGNGNGNFPPAGFSGSAEVPPAGSYDAKPSSLLTFGAGPHVCLGAGLFNLEAKVLLALLARDYDVRMEAGPEGEGPAFTYGWMPELRQPTWLKFTAKTGAAAAPAPAEAVPVAAR